MKVFKVFLLVFIFLGLAQSGFGQISEKSIDMSLGAQNGFELKLESNDVQKIERLWKIYAKNYGKFKKNRKADELYGEEVKVKSILGKDKFDMYVRIQKDGDQSKVAFWFDLGDSFMNSTDHPDLFKNTMEELMNFELFFQTTMVEEELKVEERNLSNYEKEMKNLKKDNDRYHSEIERANETIARMEENIDKNLNDQKNKQVEIELQKEKLSEVSKKLESLKKEQ